MADTNKVNVLHNICSASKVNEIYQKGDDISSAISFQYNYPLCNNFSNKNHRHAVLELRLLQKLNLTQSEQTAINRSFLIFTLNRIK